jgi:hypothetical protein
MVESTNFAHEQRALIYPYLKEERKNNVKKIIFNSQSISKTLQ